MLTKFCEEPKAELFRKTELGQDANLAGDNSIVIGLYRPPKIIGKDHFLKVEKEMNDM